MPRRADFLKLTKLTPEAHKSYVKRDQLPYVEDVESGDGDTETRADRGWKYYTWLQAFSTRVAVELVATGIPMTQASNIVVGGLDAVLDTLKTKPGGLVWFGERSIYPDGRRFVRGPLHDLVAYAAKPATHPDLVNDTPLEEAETFGLAIVNISAILTDFNRIIAEDEIADGEAWISAYPS